MRAGGAASAATQSEYLSSGNLFAHLHFHFREVHVQREQTLAMVEHHAVSLEIKRASQQYGSAIDGCDGGAGRDGKVESLMAALHFSIEGTASAENIGDGRAHGRMKVPRPNP